MILHAVADVEACVNVTSNVAYKDVASGGGKPVDVVRACGVLARMGRGVAACDVAGTVVIDGVQAVGALPNLPGAARYLGAVGSSRRGGRMRDAVGVMARGRGGKAGDAVRVSERVHG